MSHSQNRNLIRKLMLLLILALCLLGTAISPSGHRVKATMLPPCSMCTGGPNQPSSCPACVPDNPCPPREGCRIEAQPM